MNLEFKLKSMILKAFKIIDNLFRTDFKLKTGLDELPFVILMTGFNNQKYIKKSLESALNQEYKNFQIIYIDDASTDQSPQILANFKNSKLKKQLNEQRQGKLKNLFEAAHSLSNDKIILEFDGDDYLIDNLALKRFNQTYQDGAKLVYANYENNPKKIAQELRIQNFSQRIPKPVSNFRKWPWIFSGLRSYPAKFFKEIKKEDLIWNEKFLPVFHDAAIFYPMLEMAGGKTGYISQPQLIRNIDSPINDFKTHSDKLKTKIRNHVLSKKNYEKII